MTPTCTLFVHCEVHLHPTANVCMPFDLLDSAPFAYEVHACRPYVDLKRGVRVISRGERDILTGYVESMTIGPRGNLHLIKSACEDVPLSIPFQYPPSTSSC